jgi:hypothetical protein
MIYDDRGNLYRIIFLGMDNKPTSNAFGYACCEYQYDFPKREIAKKYYNVDGMQLRSFPIIFDVATGSAAFILGIEQFDAMLDYDGVTLNSTTDFCKLRDLETVDTPEKPLRIWRNGEILTFMLKPGQLGITAEDLPLPFKIPIQGSPHAE